MPKGISDYTLYRWRYLISYLLIGSTLIGILILSYLYAPGGLRSAEKTSAIISSSLSVTNFNIDAIVDLPYHGLQKLSFLVFGVTTFSIKLPTMLLSILLIVGIYNLLNNWFHKNVAVIATLIVTTASQFTFISQDGTPTIMYIFITIWLLLFALKASSSTSFKHIWLLLLAATIAFSLYTPLSAYIIIALISATVLHPHLRFIIGRMSKIKTVLIALIGIILLTPLTISIYSNPSIGLALLGIPKAMPDFQQNLIGIFQTYFDFLHPEAKGTFSPIYALPLLLLIGLGVTKLSKTRYTARSYIIIIWVVLLAPIILINPEQIAITFVPVTLLVAYGVDSLLHRWYSLFPKNPYARVFGLTLILILVIGITTSGVGRYFYIYRYNPTVARNFSNDLTLVNTEIQKVSSRDHPIALAVGPSELEFYQVVAKHPLRGYDLIISADPNDLISSNNLLIATREAVNYRNLKPVPSLIITNAQKNEADRLYLYNLSQN